MLTTNGMTRDPMRSL